MKRFIAIILALFMVLGLAACGPVNETKVAVLWSGEGVTKVPDSLINSLDRAMYIKNITYTHYGAENKVDTQLAQVTAALNGGCSALAVELVEGADAQAIADAAKAKNVPLVFFNCKVEETVLSSYDNCVLIETDVASLADTQGNMIYKYFKANNKKNELDRNDDEKIGYIAFGDVSKVIESLNKAMKDDKSKKAVTFEPVLLETVEASADAETAMADFFAKYNDEQKTMVELIITDNEEDALDVLRALQAKGFNSNKLKTHCIPLFTVGAELDAREFTDTSSLEEEEKAELIFNLRNIVSNGQIAGTAVEDQDVLAAAIAQVLYNQIKGNDAVANVEDGTVSGRKVSIPYYAYVK